MRRDATRAYILINEPLGLEPYPEASAMDWARQLKGEKKERAIMRLLSFTMIRVIPEVDRYVSLLVGYVDRLDRLRRLTPPV